MYNVVYPVFDAKIQAMVQQHVAYHWRIAAKSLYLYPQTHDGAWIR